MHIADVTHFLKPDTAMDAEAALRGTTVYLVQVGGRGTTGHYGEPGGGGGALYSVVRTEYRVLPLRLTPGAVAASRSYHFCHTVPPVHYYHSYYSPHSAQRRLDMLPKPLTEDICSLRCGADGLAFGLPCPPPHWAKLSNPKP